MANKPFDIEYEWFKDQDPENGNFDVSFKINGQILHAHRCPLSSDSNVFKEMFSQNPEHSEPIEIKDVSFEAFQNFVSLLYNTHVDMDRDYFFEVVELFEEYQVKDSIDSFENDLWLALYLIEADLFKICEALNFSLFSKYQKQLQNYVNTYDDYSLPKNVDFMKASKKAILGILTLERSNEDDAESVLFETVVSWVKNQANFMEPDNPDEYIKAEMATLLPKFDFKKISWYFLKSFTETHRSIFPSPEYIEDILNQSDKSIYKALCGNYYALSRPARQNFTFLPSMMNYLTKHWSPGIYHKLSKTCKHFFYTHRITDVKNMDNLHYLHTKPPGWRWCQSSPTVYLSYAMHKPTKSKWVSIDLSVKKLWVTGKDRFICDYPHVYKYIYPIYEKELKIKENSELKGRSYLFDLFTFTASKLTRLIIHGNMYFGSKALTLGDILSYTLNLVELDIRVDGSDESLQSLYNISRSIASGLPSLPKLKRFLFDDVSAFPNSADMLQFIQDHDVNFYFYFTNQNGYNSFKTAMFKAYPNSKEKVFQKLSCYPPNIIGVASRHSTSRMSFLSKNSQ